MGKAWQDEEVSRLFLSEVRGGIPLAREQLKTLAHLVLAAQPALQNFIDLGCGDGILGRTLLKYFPNAKGVFVDFNTHMLQAAQKEMPAAQNHRFVQADLSLKAWPSLFDANARFGAVVSGFAIHHLPDARKRELYGEIHRLLIPGGIFLNLEHVASPAPWIAQIHEELFIDSLFEYQTNKGATQTREQVAARFRERIEKTENILALVETQCAWLREIGFQEVDCYLKYFELALFGGVKFPSIPTKRST
jgi:ubiquinone/menaquinone biosynthesis C-methylase UbiE